MQTCSILLCLIGASLMQTPPATGPATWITTFDEPDAAGQWTPMTGEWKFGGGAAKQSDAGFDHGASATVKPDGPFWVGVRFKPDDGFVGGGLYFGLPNRVSRGGGMMVRCDPEVILWGKMNAAGVFDFYGNTPIDNMPRDEQELAVAVDPEKAAFNVFHNGKKVATNLMAERCDGFVGLQSSGGTHTFSCFELRPATPAELEGIEAAGEYGRVVDCVGNRANLILLRRAPELLVKLDDKGAAVTKLKVSDLPVPPGADLAPVAIAWDSFVSWDKSPGVLLLAEGGTALYRLSNDLVPQGRRVLDPQMQGVGLCVGPQGHIFVADAKTPGIRVFDPQGKPLLTYGKHGTFDPNQNPGLAAAEKFAEPAGICMDANQRIIVTDRANLTFVIYQYDAAANTLTFRQHGPWMSRPGDVAVNRQNQILVVGGLDYYGPYGALRVLLPDGRPFNAFAAYSMGMMSPRCSVALGPGARVYVPDPEKERIYIVPFLFGETPPEFRWAGSAGIQANVNAVALVAQKKSAWTDMINTRGFPNSQPQRIEIKPPRAPVETWPAAPRYSARTYWMPLAPPPGRKYVIDMPVVIAAFCKATMPNGEVVSLDAKDFGDRLQREHTVVREFYFRNSHCILNLDLEHMIIDEMPAVVKNGWIPPDVGRDLVNQVRRQRGLLPLEPEDSLVTIFPMQGWDKSAQDDPGVVDGGGLTQFAYSSYGLWNRGIAWLLCHEWNHQLDAYFEKSGVEEFWLNHPDSTVHLGRYGQHWNCNAFLMRRLDPMNWLRLKYGFLRSTPDRDSDGVPDDDPGLPFDEKRLAGDQHKADADDDTLKDLDEVMAATFSGANLRNADSDADGTPDQGDSYRCHAVRPVIRRANVTLDGQIGADEYTSIGKIVRDWVDAEVFAAHAQRKLHLALKFDKPVDVVAADVDGNDDGWFRGFDNIPAEVSLTWQNGAGGIGNKNHCEAVLTSGQDGHTLEIEIPLVNQDMRRKRPLTVGLTLHVRRGEHREAFLIDPWDILRLNMN